MVKTKDFIRFWFKENSTYMFSINLYLTAFCFGISILYSSDFMGLDHTIMITFGPLNFSFGYSNSITKTAEKLTEKLKEYNNI